MQNEKTNLSQTRKLVEGALMVAVATVLSLIKLAELPYGGSITIASMLPILLFSYRAGIGWGLGAGLTYGVIQQLLGLKNLSYFTSWQSIVAVILLDYLLAFAVIGLGGIFRPLVRRQGGALAAGAAFVCVLRYACHVLSGATVWAGLSIPTGAALAYSFIYNATYMLPESIVLIAAALYLGSVFDFRRAEPLRVVSARAKEGGAQALLPILAAALGVGALIYDTVAVFSRLQNAETGAFDIAGLAAESFAASVWPGVLIVSASAALASAALLAVRRVLRAKGGEEGRAENEQQNGDEVG